MAEGWKHNFRQMEKASLRCYLSSEPKEGRQLSKQRAGGGFQEDGSESAGALVLRKQEGGSTAGTEKVRRKVVMGTGLRDEVTGQRLCSL